MRKIIVMTAMAALMAAPAFATPTINFGGGSSGSTASSGASLSGGDKFETSGAYNQGFSTSSSSDSHGTVTTTTFSEDHGSVGSLGNGSATASESGTATTYESFVAFPSFNGFGRF